MRVRALPWFFALAATSPALSTPVTVYQNTDGPLFASNFPAPRILDDGAFSSISDDAPILLTRLNLAYFVLGPGPANFNLRINFYDRIDPLAPPNHSVVSEPLGSVALSVRGVNPGVHATGFLDLAPSGGIYFPDHDWAIEVLFYEPDGENQYSDRVVPLYAGGEPLGGPRIGTSQDRLWRDANRNGLLEAFEAFSFEGPPRRANIFLQLQGQVVPEPAALLLIAAALVWRVIRRASG